MRLSDRLLDLISTKPGITRAEIRAALVGISTHSIASAIFRMRKSGVIGEVGWGAYIIASKPKRGVPEPNDPEAFIRPLSLARLMAGR